MRGVHCNMRDSYLAEFIWHNQFGNDAFNNHLLIYQNNDLLTNMMF
jgi:hypothetical protein